MTRIGLLGLGVMGRQHLAGYAQLPGVEVEMRGAGAYQGYGDGDREALYQAMIADPALDALDLCLPTPLHPRLAIAALEAGKHVLCEKPMALDMDSCGRMVAAARASGRILMIAHVLRFAPAYEALAEAVGSGRYGRLRHLRLTRSSGRPAWGPWLLDPAQSGGAVLDLLVHDFDQAIALCGFPDTIEARPVAFGDGVACRLGYGRGDQGATVEVEGGWFADDRPFAMGFHARFEEAELTYVHDAASPLEVHSDKHPAGAIPLSAADMYTEQLRYFAGCCAGGRQPERCLPGDSARAVQLALEVRRIAGLQKDRETT
jgi:predicted dehydrogenase